MQILFAGFAGAYATISWQLDNSLGLKARDGVEKYLFWMCAVVSCAGPIIALHVDGDCALNFAEIGFCC
jgi:hypothetical protein